MTYMLKATSFTTKERREFMLELETARHNLEAARFYAPRYQYIADMLPQYEAEVSKLEGLVAICKPFKDKHAKPGASAGKEEL